MYPFPSNIPFSVRRHTFARVCELCASVSVGCSYCGSLNAGSHFCFHVRVALSLTHHLHLHDHRRRRGSHVQGQREGQDHGYICGRCLGHDVD